MFWLHLEGVMSSDHLPGFRLAKRIVVAVVGGTIMLIGIALLIPAGPGIHCDSCWPFDTCDRVCLGKKISEESARGSDEGRVKNKS